MSAENTMILVNPKDNVAVALTPLQAGAKVNIEGKEITLLDNIPFGHKAALVDVKAGENIIKYGYPIGHAKVDIKAGAHVHVHNLKTNLSGILNYTYNKVDSPLPQIPAKYKNATFDGYKRPNGTAGVRNEVWIIPTVGCVNTTAKILEKKANEMFAGKTDGFFAYTHNMGCSQLGDDQATTQKILKGIINNPNAGAVLVLSLGCENNNLKTFMPVLGEYDPNRVKFMVTQNVEDEYEAGLKILGELAEYASSFKREPLSPSYLTLGFKCGGSDAFSGITANPLCGRINDLLVSLGGSTILTEVPEMFGAETLLMNRATNEGVFHKIVSLINDFKGYFTKYKQTIYENPSPGNKDGGISSLEEKSLGCTQKGGGAQVVGVLDYGEQISTRGLNLLTGPGNDQVSVTNLTASGAQVILFTTGRGNPFGAPVPTIKISSNSNLYNNKKQWIDFNAGILLEGKTFDEATEQLFDYILALASGKVRTKNEEYGYKEISIFRDGVIL
ncbi:altronate hydrolase [Elusimicrobium simillimum]|uniref:UxaA family hydrolase n=1 Tax=Elusimicrobium simillimum TaxID=3143438 RepID=UPI003C6FEB4C